MTFVIAATNSGPFISGITTSVTSKSILLLVHIGQLQCFLPIARLKNAVAILRKALAQDGPQAFLVFD